MPGYQIEAYCPVCEQVHYPSGWGLKFPHGQVELENPRQAGEPLTTRLVPIVVCGECRDKRPGEVARVLDRLHAPAAELPPPKSIDWRKLK